jgi:hypothetical protein
MRLFFLRPSRLRLGLMGWCCGWRKGGWGEHSQNNGRSRPALRAKPRAPGRAAIGAQAHQGQTRPGQGQTAQTYAET